MPACRAFTPARTWSVELLQVLHTLPPGRFHSARGHRKRLTRRHGILSAEHFSTALVDFGLFLSRLYIGSLWGRVDKSITSHHYRIFLRELRAARKRSGLSQVQLAAKLDETQSFVSKCERGERRLDIVELRAFCSAFGISLPVFVQALEGMLSASADRTAPRRRRK